MSAIVFCDVDGTVLSHTTGKVPASTKHCIKQLQANGVLVWGCTGRTKNELEQLPLADLNLDGWITMNGAYCYQNDTVISKTTIDPDDLAIIVQELRTNPFPVQFFETKRNYMNMITDEVVDALAQIHTLPDPILPLEEIQTDEVCMIIPWLCEERWKPIYDKLKHIQQVRWNDLAIDCFRDDCGKDKGIQAVLDYLHIPFEESYAIGDGMNDIAMFQAVKTSIAMGNAKEEVKQCAAYTTDDIDQDGFAHIFTKLFTL